MLVRCFQTSPLARRIHLLCLQHHARPNTIYLLRAHSFNTFQRNSSFGTFLHTIPSSNFAPPSFSQVHPRTRSRRAASMHRITPTFATTSVIRSHQGLGSLKPRPVRSLSS